jgi:queuine tRNA-ribosyltransferase
MLSFEVFVRDRGSAARRGRLGTARGFVETPAFMPVGTGATVKAVSQEILEQLGARLILANTYHLYLRPGTEVVEALGGLHRFMSWKGPILTDSGGYQVFSHRGLNRITEEGVEFRSHLDGGRHFFSPEKSMEVQRALGSDIVMAFDECTPYPVGRAEARNSMLRSMRWAERCRAAMTGSRQALFGIAQGSVYRDLRRESLERIVEMDFPGVAVGGLSVGEPRMLMYEILGGLEELLPADRPRYLMGVGTPADLVLSVERGYDMFDCVLPTRNARNGTLFTWSGLVRIKNRRHRGDGEPLDAGCRCFVCRRYSRAYLRHLFVSGEILAAVLNTCHNLHFYLDLMDRIRRSIESGTFRELRKCVLEAYDADAPIVSEDRPPQGS